LEARARFPINPWLSAAALPFVTLGFIILIVGFIFSAVMRDGLGPESHLSYGAEAVSKFLILYVPIAALGAFFLFYGGLLILVARFADRLPYSRIALILLLTPAIAAGIITQLLVGGRPAGQPSNGPIDHGVKQYSRVIEAIEAFRLDNGKYPPDLTALVPDYLSEPPDVYIEGTDLVDYFPLPSLGEAFTFYVWGHNTKQGFRQIWEEWELRYCRLNSCTYPSEYFPVQRIDENWILIYRPDRVPLIFHPFTLAEELEPAPLPGWRYPVSEILFAEASAFPDGWTISNHELVSTDPIINRVARYWFKEGTSGSARQVIRRAFSVEDAHEAYTELVTQIYPVESQDLIDSYEGFDFQGQAADEFSLVCGCWTSWECRILERYQNYIVEMHFDLEAEHECEGYLTPGLTKAEIEVVVEASDVQFANLMATLYPNKD
jgi:hypothetical protein